MNLSTITSRKESKGAFDALKACLMLGAKKFRRKLGHQGDSIDSIPLYWHKDVAFWVAFGEANSRFWCAYGTKDPDLYGPHVSFEIACEINPPTEGIDRRCGGIFLKDSASGLYLAHSGKVGGGRKGIGKTNFLKEYGGHLQEIEWLDGITAKVVVLGKIGSRSFLVNLAAYIREVEKFKANAQSIPASIIKKNLDIFFTAEFEGPRKKYKLTDAIESQCSHGTVVNTLKAELKSLGFDAYNTNIDLFLVDKIGNKTHLFEVKTDQISTSLYQAVGQVMLHGALDKSDLRRIVVLPGKVSLDTANRMKKLGIKVVLYNWRGDKPIFQDLKKAIS